MFASIVSKVTTIVRKAVRAVGVAVGRSPWIAPAAILAVFFLM
jgi:hypothetical protein